MVFTAGEFVEPSSMVSNVTKGWGGGGWTGVTCTTVLSSSVF